MKVKDLEFEITEYCDVEDTLFSVNGDYGRITVLDRMTGFGYPDIETGFKNPEGLFWLASGYFDIRNFPDLTIEEAIEKIKKNANTCDGV